MKRIVLLRHGESLWNQENRFTGWTDVDLSEKGVVEACKAGDTLREAGFSFEIAYTSYLKRAIKTLVRNNDFFGGNFAGIREKLPYLQELGVGVLYLNPIFMAWSNHRYDTADYRRPDPMLGTEEDFRTLCDAAHARGMRVILDGVFSHTGSNSVYFDAKHVFGHGAASDPNSPYRRWYRFHHYPDDYEAWWGIRTLPCVEELDETYLHYIIEDEDSVIAHWLRLGADGFRLDVVDELPDEFVRRLRRRMRQIDPQSLLLGEVWEDASNKRAYGVSRRYFVDGELDSVMNYPWRNAIVAFLTDADDGTALGESLMTLAENYPPEVLSCVMNHLGTHDTPRILTVLGEPFRGTKDERARRRMTPVQRKTALMRLRMAAFLQFTLPGMPCIYYGDEAGMEGFEDPFCRVCYPWGHEDEELQAYYRMMSALRGSSEALRRGGLRVLAAGNGRIAFSRSIGGERHLPQFGLYVQGAYGNPGLNMLKNEFSPYYIAGVRLSWNFGSLYTLKNDRQVIENKRRQLNNNRDVFLFNTRLEMTQQDQAIRSLEKQMKDDDEIIRLRTNIRKSAEAKVANGTLTVTEMLRELTNESLARQTKAMHEIQRLKGIYQLKYTTNH